MEKTKISGGILLISIILIFISCTQEVGYSSHLYYDYEIIEDEYTDEETEETLMPIVVDTITLDIPRADLIRHGEWIWNRMTRTKYVHYHDKIIDDMFGIYMYDCSGFVYSIILYEVLKEHADNLLEWKQQLHPTDYGVRAWTFYDYFRDNILSGDEVIASNEYWKVFMSVDSLKKGDLIIVRYDDDWREEMISNGEHASTGHVMIAWDVGEVDENNEVIITVYDCASSGHTKSIDTRYNSIPIAEINEDSDKPSGIGFGKMKYKISQSHRRPYAYKWSINSKYWYNLYNGDDINEPGIKYDRIKGIIFARPI